MIIQKKRIFFRSKEPTKSDAEETEKRDKEEKAEADEEEEVAQRPTDYMSGALGLIPSQHHDTYVYCIIQ